jgi:D-alanyl-D-alanine-carboxypeptidase/D-alanyl-D-alanine-endopeptidase
VKLPPSKPPSGVVLARWRDGEVEVESSGPVPADGVFELGSITKAVTGLLLADAIVRGDVALDTPLSDCLPTSSPITLSALATHTAGLPRLPLAFVRRAGFTNRTDPYEGSTVDDLLADLQRVRLRRPRLRYSNFGPALLGQALAARAGAPYEDLVHTRVLEPLGIGEVWAQGAPDVVQPYDRRGRPVPPWTLDAYAPAGCLRGTVRGALALSIACLERPTEAVALALTPRARRGPMEAGLGWMRMPAARDVRMWWHNGGTHGSRAFTGFVPGTRSAVAAVTNSPRSPDGAAAKALAQPSS